MTSKYNTSDEPEDDDNFVNSDGVCEVIVVDVTLREYVYWVRTEGFSDADSPEDEAIAVAIAYHQIHVGTEIHIDADEIEQAFGVYPPLSRLEGEFTWIDN